MRNGTRTIGRSGRRPLAGLVALAAIAGLSAGVSVASEEAPGDAAAGWRQAAQRDGELAWELYVETDPAPGVPAFRIETRFDVPPAIAAFDHAASLSRVVVNSIFFS